MGRQAKAKVWGIYVPQDRAIPLPTLRTTRAACIKEYVRFYSGKRRPKFTWAQLYRWGWRCLPVTIQFNQPR